MFGLGQKKEDPVSVFTPPDKPVPTLVEVGTESLGAYEELATELGFLPAQLLEEQLYRFLNENKIPTYDGDEVDKYLAAHAEQEEKVWIWRPLRECDQPEGWHWEGRESEVLGISEWEGHGSYRNDWNYRPYEKAVPIHILRHVKKIQDKFGDRVLFFVSDYAVPDPDPFIMVTALDVNKIIFGVWDEPGFSTSNK